MIKTRILLPILAAALVLSAAFTPLSAFGERNAAFIEMNVSEEAKALAAELMESSNADITTEGIFDAIVPSLYERGEQALPEVAVENKLDHFKLGEMQVYSLGKDDTESVVLYLHGGAWIFGIDPSHVTFCDKLSGAMNAKVYIPLYPLAPQNNCEAAYTAIYELYTAIAAQGKRVFVMGDSAGGNIALGLTHLTKENDAAMPDALVLISPCADMTFSNPEMEEIESVDPTLRMYGCAAAAKLWADGRPLDDPLLSALYADVSGYPKTMLFFGTSDILYPDGLKLYEKLKEADVETVFVKAEGLFHVFPLYEIPEQNIAIELIAGFCG